MGRSIKLTASRPECNATIVKGTLDKVYMQEQGGQNRTLMPPIPGLIHCSWEQDRAMVKAFPNNVAPSYLHMLPSGIQKREQSYT